LRENDPDRWKKYWEDPKVKLIHFIGKDNIVFHTVVWPSILIGDGRYPLPYLVAGNEFLNLEGEKISTSRNFAIWAGEVAQIVDPELLRYYLTKISPETSDANFTWADFQAKVNSDLADIIGNLANRALSFLNKNYGGLVNSDTNTPDSKVTEQIDQTFKRYCSHLDEGLSKLALEDVVDLGRFLNGYLQESAPWKTRKTDPALAHRSLHAACVGIKALAILLYPICPKIADKIWKQLGFNDSIKSRKLDECQTAFPAGHKISEAVEPIVAKIEDEFVEVQRAKLEAVLNKK
jgi:methionyl-tRNA synthetase